MKSFRLVMVGSVVVACFFLTGFKKPIHHYEPTTKKQHLVVAEKGQQKPLDLTVPLKDDSFQGTPETLTIVQGSMPVAFTGDKKSKTRAVELQGRAILTQEQEPGKAKSADGAGIVINLHH
jgi:hypothetical protein